MNIEPLHYKWQLGDWRCPSEQGPKVVVRICNPSISVGWGCKRLRVRRCQTRRLDAVYPHSGTCFAMVSCRCPNNNSGQQLLGLAAFATGDTSNLESGYINLAPKTILLFLMFLPLIGIPHFWAFPGVESNAHSARFALFGNWLKTFERGVAAVQQPVKASKKTR